MQIEIVRFGGTISDGGVLSTTVMVAVQDPVAPDGSVHVRTTAVAPRPNGPAGLNVQVIGSPSGSDDPPSTSAGTAVPRHIPLALVVKFLQTATGGRLSLIPTEADGMPLATTTSVLGPDSMPAGASNVVETTSVLPTASTPIRL